MADSVIGGGSSTGGSAGLGDTAKEIFDTVLDPLSEADKALLETLAGTGGTVEVASIGDTDTTYVQAVNTTTGADGKPVQETISKLISTAADVLTDVQIPSGNLTFEVSLPANVDLQIQGPAVNQTVFQATSFFGALIEGWIPGESTYKDAFNSAVGKAMDHAGDGTSIRLITPTDNATGSANLAFSGSPTANETVVINMYGVQANRAIDIKDFDGTVLLGPGTVNVVGAAGAFVTGDEANQKITGGAGGDTLIGGGGSDILTGGSGADTFGVGFNGDTLITDFSARDKLLFDGSMTLQSFLQANISVVQLGTFAVTNISSEGHNIYLVGVDPSQLTLDMLKFDV